MVRSIQDAFPIPTPGGVAVCALGVPGCAVIAEHFQFGLWTGNIDQYHLSDLTRKTEHYIKRKIRSLVLTKEEFIAFKPKLENRPNFLAWERQEN